RLHQREATMSCASSANLLVVVVCRPPRSRINRHSVLSKFHVKRRRAGAGEYGGPSGGPLPHYGVRLSGQYELANVDRNSVHAGHQHVIPTAGIQNQQLSVGAVWRRVDHPSVAGGRYLGTWARHDRDPLFGATDSIGCSETLGLHAIHRQRQKSLGRSKCDRGTEPAWTGRVLLIASSHERPRWPRRRLLFKLADQVSEVVDLASQLRGALALGVQRGPDRRLPLLTLRNER